MALVFSHHYEKALILYELKDFRYQNYLACTDKKKLFFFFFFFFSVGQQTVVSIQESLSTETFPSDAFETKHLKDDASIFYNKAKEQGVRVRH